MYQTLLYIRIKDHSWMEKIDKHTWYYNINCMACVCSQYNTCSDWLVLGHYSPLMPTSQLWSLLNCIINILIIWSLGENLKSWPCHIDLSIGQSMWQGLGYAFGWTSLFWKIDPNRGSSNYGNHHKMTERQIQKKWFWINQIFEITKFNLDSHCISTSR